MVVKFGEVSETLQIVVEVVSVLVGLVCVVLLLRRLAIKEEMPAGPSIGLDGSVDTDVS